MAPLLVKDNPDIFRKKRVLVIGDIAFDHSYYCSPVKKGFHAYHANEQIFDIEPGGDDYGAVGSANNISLFANSFRAESFLISLIGKDPEGKRVKEILKKNRVKYRFIELKGVQTVTRLRFYIHSQNKSGYELAYRMDKEPDYDYSYKASMNYMRRSSEFRKLLEKEIRMCSTLIFDDTEKGFISREFVEAVSGIIANENAIRRTQNLPEIVTVADPKNNWQKFHGLPGIILKPNLKETLKELDLEIADGGINPESTPELNNLILVLKSKFGGLFSQFVITLGRNGALYVRFDKDMIYAYRCPAVISGEDSTRTAAHCGDIFSAALGLALTLPGVDILSAITFANWAGYLQYNKKDGEKVGLLDLLEAENPPSFPVHVNL